ncbi:MAG TPA: hypothetical protein VNU26_04845 [Mycobacteriales bacterium]|nr:hypothetical protein [Mycobacteriales bacterium]
MSSFLRTQWDRAAAWACTLVGLVLLLIGYIRISGTAYPAEQVPYLISAGLGALFLLGLAGTLWLSADLRDEHAKLDEIARLLSHSAEPTYVDPIHPGDESVVPQVADGVEQGEEPVAATPSQRSPRPRRVRRTTVSTSSAGEP